MYTSRNDIGKDHNWPAVYDDMAILTMVLEPDEYTKPVLFMDDEAWHSNLPYQSDAMEEMMGMLWMSSENCMWQFTNRIAGHLS